MTLMIYEKISEYFSQREFQRIPTDSENVKMYATYQKSCLYLINLIQLGSHYIMDKERYLQYKEITKKQLVQDFSDRVILLNIILTEDTDKLRIELDIPPHLEDEFIDICWLIDTDQKELIIPKNQIRNVIRLERDLRNLLDDKETERIVLEKRQGKPIITYSLIVINALIWLLLEQAGGSLNSETLVKFGALYAPNIMKYNEFWRLFTANFIHIGASHLFFNCFSLYIFGSRLEMYLSRSKYLLIYLGAGIFGSAFSLCANLIMDNYAISAGASGAIYGLIGSIIVCSHATGKSLDGLNAYIMVLYFIAGMTVSFVSLNVDSSAHLGGFIGGILLTFILATRKA